jgi:hypothetical protein
MERVKIWPKDSNRKKAIEKLKANYETQLGVSWPED